MCGLQVLQSARGGLLVCVSDNAGDSWGMLKNADSPHVTQAKRKEGVGDSQVQKSKWGEGWLRGGCVGCVWEELSLVGNCVREIKVGVEKTRYCCQKEKKKRCVCFFVFGEVVDVAGGERRRRMGVEKCGREGCGVFGGGGVVPPQGRLVGQDDVRGCAWGWW